jgi:hypothetical protein
MITNRPTDQVVAFLQAPSMTRWTSADAKMHFRSLLHMVRKIMIGSLCRSISGMCTGCLRPGSSSSVWGKPIQFGRRQRGALQIFGITRGAVDPPQHEIACLRQTPESISQSASSTRFTAARTLSMFRLSILSASIARSVAECSLSASM